jgi:hypothetical protein
VILRQLVEIRVDTEKFDLTQWQEEAAGAGWADEPSNGIWFLAEDIISQHDDPRGLTFEILPNDPYVGESR